MGCPSHPGASNYRSGDEMRCALCRRPTHPRRRASAKPWKKVLAAMVKKHGHPSVAVALDEIAEGLK